MPQVRPHLPTTLLGFAAAVVGTTGCATESPPPVAGHACIVLDLRRPDQCGEMAVVEGLLVEELVTGEQATTDAEGEFALALPDTATTAVLRVGVGASDRRTTLVAVDALPTGDVLVPMITNTLWTTYLNALGVEDDPTTAVIHVAFPSPGALLGSVIIDGSTQLLINQGEPFVWAAQPPLDGSVALMAFGVPADTGTATIAISLRDDTTLTAEVPVQAGATTWLHFEP